MTTFDEAANAYNSAIALLAHLKSKNELTSEIGEELISIAMGVLRDTTKPDADPADVQTMIDTISSKLRAEFIAAH